MKRTYNEQAATEAGYPSTLFNFTPNERGYWVEPGLPWVAHELKRHAERAWQLAEFETDAMAPRFTLGTTVAIERMQQGQPLEAGVYVWKTHAGAWKAGRLEKAHSGGGDGLTLSLDNRSYGIVCVFEWEWSDFRLYRVTHYNSIP